MPKFIIRGEKGLYDIITTGSATVDVFAHTDSQLVKFVTNHGEDDFIAFPSGSKILINKLDFMIGGGGTNTAVSFSRLGLKTAYVGKLGSDANADKVLALLDEEHVDFLGAQEGQTGYSIVLDTLEQDRTILTFKGCNDQLHYHDIQLDKFQTKWLYSSSLTGTSQDTLKKLVMHCKEQDINVAFNPSNYQAKLGYHVLKDIIDHCKVLVMNKEEAALLFLAEEEPELLSTFLQEHPNTYLVITDGEAGAICHYQGEEYGLTPSPRHQVVETTGAGDAFASGFVAGLIHHYDVVESLKLGMVQAESVITEVGAKNGLLIKEIAIQRMEQFTGKYGKSKEVFAPKKPIKKDHLPEFYETTPNQAFKFDNNHSITSLEELGYYLRFVDDTLYSKHVGDGYNHFADWVEHVFGLPSLATQLRSTKDKDAQSTFIVTFVHRGGNI